MSWLIGWVGPAPDADIPEAHDAPRHGVQEPGIYAQTGGLELTCAGGALPGGGSFLVTGLAVQAETVLTCENWAERLNPPDPRLQDLDGHFVAFRWRSGCAELFTDPLGVRTAYLKAWQGGTLFCTRLDWLANIVGGLDIDFAAFGAHWLLANQLTTESQAHNVLRLGPGGHAVMERGQLRVTEQPWESEIHPTDPDGDAFADALSRTMRWKSPVAWSLGLSGGLDSRLLLALHTPASTHVWGPSDHPDVDISGRIARSETLRHHVFSTPVPTADECLALLRKRIAHTQVIAPASSVASLDYYGRLHAMGLGVIDGGFGEVARRQFMNRLLARRAFRGPSSRIMQQLSVGRAHIFSPEIAHIMHDGARTQIAAQWDALPHAMDPENAVDLLGVRTRLPNFFGLEQNYLDGQAACYMPFAQPSVLHALFQVPLAQRRNGKLFRRLIKHRRASLARHPLVKGTVTYPYGLGTYGAYAVSTLKKRFGRAYSDPRPHQFLNALKPYILDLTASAEVQNYAPYDPGAVRALAEAYYRGDLRQASHLDWWLTFEIWRQALRG